MPGNNITIIDDDFVIRQVVKTYLAAYVKDINLYTADDGVEGLGLFFVSNPALAIIDTTLPKYSGREISDYLFSNENLPNSRTRILLSDDGSLKQQIPDNFRILHKNKGNYLSTIFTEIAEVLPRGNVKLPGKFKLGLGESVLSWANRADVNMYRAQVSRNIFKKIAAFGFWL